MLIGLIGKKRAGKDTFARRLVERHGYVRYAFADPLKDMALRVNPYVSMFRIRLAEAVSHYGWEGAKDEFPEVRRLLQDLGLAARQVLGEDVWLSATMRKVVEEPRPVVITDVRFRNEAQAIRDAGGYLVRIVRPGHDDGDTHPSETELDDWPQDYTVMNDSEVQALWDEADYVVDLMSNGKR